MLTTAVCDPAADGLDYGKTRLSGDGPAAWAPSPQKMSPARGGSPMATPHGEPSASSPAPSPPAAIASRPTLAQRLNLTGALPPRQRAKSKTMTTRGQHPEEHTGKSDFDCDIRLDGAARAAKLRSILAMARKRAERHVKTAEEQVSHSTATHQRIREIRRVMAGGADAAFSLTIDTESPGPAYGPATPASSMHSPSLPDSTHSAGLTPKAPSPGGGVTPRTMSRAAISPLGNGRSGLAIFTAPMADIGSAEKQPPPSLADMTEGVAYPDAVAATEFAAQYSTAAVNTQLRNVSELTANFRAELHNVALRTDSALKRTRPAVCVRQGSSAAPRSDTSARKRLNMTG